MGQDAEEKDDERKKLYSMLGGSKSKSTDKVAPKAATDDTKNNDQHAQNKVEEKTAQEKDMKVEEKDTKVSVDAPANILAETEHKHTTDKVASDTKEDGTHAAVKESDREAASNVKKAETADKKDKKEKKDKKDVQDDSSKNAMDHSIMENLMASSHQAHSEEAEDKKVAKEKVEEHKEEEQKTDHKASVAEHDEKTGDKHSSPAERAAEKLAEGMLEQSARQVAKADRAHRDHSEV